MTSSPRFCELSLEGNGIYLLVLVNNQKKKKKVSGLEIEGHLFLILFSLFSGFLSFSPLPLPHPKHSQLSWEPSDLI